LNWNTWVRQIHRWLGAVFTVMTILSFAAVVGVLPFWVVYLPLPPLGLQLVTGVYLFVLPYAARWRGGRRAARAQ
jgi:hypothetical protein